MFKKIFIITLLTASAFAVMNANAALSSGSNDGLTLTPYGWVPKSRVIAVTPNESIGISAEGNVVLKDIKTGSIIREYAKVDTKTLTSFDSQRNIKNLPGHIAEYNVTAPAKDISFFTTSWIVPKKPKNPSANATFYIYGGISDDTSRSLVSALEWTGSSKEENNGGYQIFNWVFAHGYYIHGPYLPVSPGDKLTALILCNKGVSGWYYSVRFTGYPKADLNYENVDFKNPIKPSKVFENFVSTTADLDEIPASECTKMTKIFVATNPQVSRLNWKVDKGDLPLVTPSGKNVVIVSNLSLFGELDFYFH